jgi:MerR family redox-sensitive transcriptional activator SoxR
MSQKDKDGLGGALTIGQVSRQAGLRPSTLRYYESLGLLPPPTRLYGKRRYTRQVFQDLAVLRLAQQAGFSLRDMQTLLHGFPADVPASDRWHQLAGPKIAEVEAAIARAQQTKHALELLLECECRQLDECAAVCCEAEAR